ncbi:hypothetical protein BV898_11482 [Hypsibius exemplaris]|uniref:CxC5 like cysteine cluster associated with KDZ domain-containing protein n=1 Tax=Hypsibius exemplaris TaxID=2072580 RepID=A0A1W0WGN7_HYPEX|nr:hypothetical protein BV898_11482 [Hypsibius exemplaris]
MEKSLVDLCRKYGFYRLTQLRKVFCSLPESLPLATALQALATSLQITVEEAKVLVENARIVAPKLLEKSQPQQDVFFLCPPPHSRPAFLDADTIPQVTVYDLDREVGRGYEYTLRCTSCKARYGYATYYDPNTKKRLFYNDSRELLCVNRSTYWTRAVAELMINNILHSQTTFEGFAETLRTTFGWTKSFNRKMVSNAFYAHEIETELKQGGERYEFATGKINCKGVKRFIENLRKAEIYHHNCGTEGQQRGCKYLSVMDGFWKLCHRHCHMRMERSVDMRYVNLPPVCETEPANGVLYCKEHVVEAKRHGLPITKNDLLVAGKKHGPCRQQLSDESLNMFEVEMDQMTDQKERKNANNKISCLSKVVVAPWCKKNLGQRKKVGSWSRGLFVFVDGCGHISSLSPLYQSESMSQVFLIVMDWLQKRWSGIPLEEWSKCFLFYDNIQHTYNANNVGNINNVGQRQQHGATWGQRRQRGATSATWGDVSNVGQRQQRGATPATWGNASNFNNVRQRGATWGNVEQRGATWSNGGQHQRH